MGPRQNRYPQEVIDAFSNLSVALIADAQNGDGLIDPKVKAITEGIRICGPALTVHCPFRDNLMLHKAISIASSGDLITVEIDLSPKEKNAWDTAILGGLLAFAAKQREVAGIVVDGHIRDSDVIRDMKFPVFSRGVNVNRPTKNKIGSINHLVHVGGIEIYPGDLIVGDGDGLIRVRNEDATKVLQIALELEQKETDWKGLIAGGKSTLEILDLGIVIWDN